MAPPINQIKSQVNSRPTASSTRERPRMTIRSAKMEKPAKAPVSTSTPADTKVTAKLRLSRVGMSSSTTPRRVMGIDRMI